jgi:hypothetical protein
METACYVAGSIGGQASYLTLTATRLSQITPESVVGTDQGIDNSVVPFQTLYSLNGKAYSDSGVVTTRTVQFNAVAGTAVVAEGAGVLMSFTGVQGVNLSNTDTVGGPTRLNDVISLATSCTAGDRVGDTVFPDTLTCRTIAIDKKNVFNSDAPEFSAAEFTLELTDLEEIKQCSFFYVPEDEV